MIFLIHQHTTQVMAPSSTAARKHSHLGGAVKASSQATQSVPNSQSDHFKVSSGRKEEVEKVTSTQVGKVSILAVSGQKETTSSSDKSESNVNDYHSTLAGIDSSSRHQGDKIISDLEVLIATAYICVLCGLSGTE